MRRAREPAAWTRIVEKARERAARVTDEERNGGDDPHAENAERAKGTRASRQVSVPWHSFAASPDTRPSLMSTGQ